MTDWQALLKPFDPIWTMDELSGFDNTTLENECFAVPLLAYQLLLVSGKDAETFLQGQLTCDIKRLAEGDHLLGAHCNAKGRMISSMQVFKFGPDCIALRVRKNLVDTAFQALKKYIVFSKAKLQISPWLGIALLPQTGGLVPKLGDLALPAAGKIATLDPGICLNHGNWLELWQPSPDVASWLQVADATLAAPPLLETFLVREGRADVQPPTSEEFIPQMFNYDLLDGVSFKKGCYTGQEIVARLHYRGQAKKRLFVVRLAHARVGDELVASDKPEQAVGTVVAAAESDALVCVNTEIYNSSTRLNIRTKSDAILEWGEQPYAIP